MKIKNKKYRYNKIITFFENYYSHRKKFIYKKNMLSQSIKLDNINQHIKIHYYYHPKKEKILFLFIKAQNSSAQLLLKP